jgi:hypothetical protein
MSSDEESGSSTSSCDEDNGLQNNSNSGGSAHQSGRSSPRIKTGKTHVVACAGRFRANHGSCSAEVKPVVPIKTEQAIKTEIKVEDISAPINNAQRLPGLPGGKEEDYDSSATVSWLSSLLYL